MFRLSNPMRSKKDNFVLSDLWWQFQNSPENGEIIKLFQIIREGNIRELINMLDTIGDIRTVWEIKDGVGVSALHITVKFDRPELAEILLKRGADPNVMSLSRGTPLATACRFNRDNIVRLYMKYGADPLLGLPTVGNTLHIIAMHSTVHIADVVFRSIKPPVNSRTELGRTPLHNAAQSGNDGVCQWLLRHGADPKVRCIRRATPLMMACKYGHVTTMRILIMADKCSLNSPDHILNELDDEGNGPLHYAVIDNQTEVVQELLQLGCNPNLQNASQQKNSHLITALHICATDGYIQLITLLYDYKAKLDIRDLKGKTALHKAVEHNKSEIVKTLLNLGADINIQDNKQFTPLMSASFKGNVDTVSLLLIHGADAGVKNHIGQTCLSVATHVCQFDVLQVLVAECNECLLNGLDLFDQSVLHHAARLKDVRFINLLLQKGCLPNIIDALHEFPLHVAAKYGSYATVKRLVEVTKDINAENFEQKSAFFMACEMGNRETIRALIETGANVKDTDIHLRNTIMMAAMHGYTDVVIDLIDKGVPLNCRDEERNTALHLACSNGHVNTVQVLLDNNVSVTCTNIHDQSPLCLAVDKRQTEVVMTMVNHYSWEESLSVRDKSGATCIDKMIANTPEAVKAVLDKCVQKSMHDPTHEEYKIEFNYKYIDPGPKDPMSKKYNYNALLTMVRHEREDLLMHDLCQSLMVYKWRCFGKLTFVLDSCLQVGYIILLVIFYLIMNKPNDPGYNCQATTNSSINNTLTENRPAYRYDVIWTILFAIYAFSLVLICRELKNALWGWSCMRSSTFWMSMVSILLINLCLVPPGYEPCDNQWRLFIYGTCIFFIRESVMIQRFATLGLYFTMFFEVFKTMLKVFILMMFFTLVFSVPLSVMLKQIGVAVGDINKVERRAYLTRLKTQIRYLIDAEVMPFMWLRQRIHTEKIIVMPNLPPRSFLQRIKKKYLNGEQIMYMKKKMNKELTSEPAYNVQRELNLQKHKIEELRKMIKDILNLVTELSRTSHKDEVSNNV